MLTTCFTMCTAKSNRFTVRAGHMFTAAALRVDIAYIILHIQHKTNIENKTP